MTPPVQPIPPSPQEIARIQGNVAKMRAQGAPESDVLAYLQHEDSQPPTPDTGLSFRNLGRSAVQGATFGFGDEMGLTDRNKENAFKADHPVADFLAKLGGGMVAPIAAVAAAPALGTTAGGAALLGGGIGLLNGVGDAEGDATNRLESGVKGGLLGAGGGALGYGLGKMVGGIGSAIMDRMHPERAVARSASELIDPAVSARLAQVNQIAPGGASLATTAVPSAGEKVSRMLPMLRAVGASPEAGASAEASFTAQKAALDAARKGLGQRMDAITGDVPVTPQLRSTMGRVRALIASHAPEVPENDVYVKTPPKLVSPAVPEQTITTAQSPHPDLRTAISDFWKGPGIAFDRKAGTVEQQMAKRALDRHITESAVSPSLRGSPTVIPAQPAVYSPPEIAPETMDVQELRDALSRLRFMSRQVAKRGVDAPGQTLKDITDAQNELQGIIYQHSPEFADLDRPYAVASEQLRQTDKALKTVQRSRANYSANDAYGATSGSLGGSLPRGSHGVVMELLDKILTNKAGAADAVAQMIAKPGGPELVQGLLSQVPGQSGRVSRYAAPVASAAIPAMRGLLFPQSP